MSPVNLRRLRTAKKIQAAAVRLAVRDGLSNITTESIALEAGVSPRTFFNYYPYKEAALIGPPPDYPADAAEIFVAGHGTLIADLDRLITAHLSRFLDERETLGHVLRLSETDAKLKALRNDVVLARRSQLADLLQRRMPAQDPRVAKILAGAITSATNAATQEWALGQRDDFIAAARENLALILPAARLLAK